MITLNNTAHLQAKSCWSAALAIPRPIELPAPRIVASGYPTPPLIPPHLKEWHHQHPTYAPHFYESEVVLKNNCEINPTGWADAPHPTRETILKRKQSGLLKSFEGEIRLSDMSGLPLNPRGRTGITGRGLLGHWGANFAADALITRYNRASGELEMLAIQRTSGEWAIPGGMVDPGEEESDAAIRELAEESGLFVNSDKVKLVYRGYVEDPRNTDNAWMETSLFHLHLSETDLAFGSSVQAGSDAKNAQWRPITPHLIDSLYASHGSFVKMALSQMHARKELGEVSSVPDVERALSELPHEPLLTNMEVLKGRIGIIGGSFDPVHLGHVQTAKAAMRAHNLDSVVFIPAKKNPLKLHAPLASDDERMIMLQKALSDEPRLFVSPLEIRKEGGRSYTVETLREVKKLISPESSLFFIIGSDCTPTLNRWRAINEVRSIATIIPVQRKGHNRAAIESLSPTLGEIFVDELLANYVDSETEDISSTMLRAGQKKDDERKLPHEIKKFIESQKLYWAEQGAR